MKTSFKLSGAGLLWALAGAVILMWVWQPAPSWAVDAFLIGIIGWNLAAFVVGMRERHLRRKAIRDQQDREHQQWLDRKTSHTG